MNHVGTPRQPLDRRRQRPRLPLHLAAEPAGGGRPRRLLPRDAAGVSLLAEHDENEVRKDFTVSERVAITEAIREKIGNRRGERTDLPKHQAQEEELRGNCPHVKPDGKTLEFVAKIAGFASDREYRRAATVVSLLAC